MSPIKKNPSLIPVLAVLLGLTIVGGLMLHRIIQMGYLEKGGSLPVYGEMPSFTLTERSGQTFGLANLKGRVWVANIIFTRCGGPCPFMSARAKQLSDKFESAVVVSFTSDPDYDTPEVLRKYADRYKADAKRWLFLTGPMEDINRISEGLMFGRMGQPDMHSTRFTLIDSKSRIRGTYDSNNPEALARLDQDLRALL
ncbi:MAG: SCO family protein [Candidatus Omnitrophica bacterium]|jgi:protein SCO1/2|nr:SCO family protein [Candidatus Omnitrophota bacterium]